MVTIVGGTDPKSNIEPRLISLLERELASFDFTIECQKKGLVKGRKFVADFYIPEIKTVIEVDGGVFISSSHTGSGRVKDCDRDMLLMMNPEVVRVVRVTTDNINLNLVRLLRKLLKS
jgi:very-short-patch-repair endonuclease